MNRWYIPFRSTDGIRTARHAEPGFGATQPGVGPDPGGTGTDGRPGCRKALRGPVPSAQDEGKIGETPACGEPRAHGVNG